MAVAGEQTGVEGLDSVLSAIVARTAEVAGADVVVARLLDDSGGLTARAVHAASAALRAELEGSRLGAGAIPAERIMEGNRTRSNPQGVNWPRFPGGG